MILSQDDNPVRKTGRIPVTIIQDNIFHSMRKMGEQDAFYFQKERKSFQVVSIREVFMEEIFPELDYKR